MNFNNSTAQNWMSIFFFLYTFPTLIASLHLWPIAFRKKKSSEVTVQQVPGESANYKVLIFYVSGGDRLCQRHGGNFRSWTWRLASVCVCLSSMRCEPWQDLQVSRVISLFVSLDVGMKGSASGTLKIKCSAARMLSRTLLAARSTTIK